MMKAWPWLDELRPRGSHEHSRGGSPRHFAYMNGLDMHGENSGNEPNGQHENAIRCIDAEMVAAVQNTLHHQMEKGPGGIDESRVCLLDTACTSCMHSREWRLAYEKHLPPGLQCSQTDQLKTFHFANGSSTEEQVRVWKIPMLIAGHRGEVFSAEIPTGSVPLLLSIAAMEALDMTLSMRSRQVQIGVLNVQVPMLITRTKHRAIDITGEGEDGEIIYNDTPISKSEHDDLFLYLVEESTCKIEEGALLLEPVPQPQLKESRLGLAFEARGIRTSDVRKQVSQRRAEELEKSSRLLRLQDKRTWVALRRSYTFAEAAATKQFTTTVVFEPFAGSFAVTRISSEEYGWTNSQPMDIMDGYDLLSAKGQRLLWNTLKQHRPYLVILAFDCRIWSLLNNLTHGEHGQERVRHLRATIGARTLHLVVRICLFQNAKGRYYLVENPAGSLAWAFNDILSTLIEKGDGKYIISDQCAYGKRDAESGRPIRKATGWLSNSEGLLNELGKRCKCKFGTHQVILGSNRFGLRSRQAAEYPLELCRAICRGIMRTMQIDYAISLPKELSYPAFDDQEEEDVMMEPVEIFEEEPSRDFWEVQVGKIIRYHVVARQRLFSPMSVDDMPCGFHELLPGRVTYLKFEDGEEQRYEDEWTSPFDPFKKEGGRTWLGRTEILVLNQQDEEEPAPGTPGIVPETPMPSPSTPPLVGEPSPGTPGVLRRKRARTRQLQRGFWMHIDSQYLEELLQKTSQELEKLGTREWQIIPLNEELGQEWVNHESANAEVTLILASRQAKKLRKPQPHGSPAEMPLRKSNLLLKNGQCLSTSWEEWLQLSPSTQTRPLVAAEREVCVILFGKILGDENVVEDGGDSRALEKEKEREQKWQSLPRELKLAIRRVHVNLGHAPIPQMLRALRVSRASEVAIRACRLFRCVECPRVQAPKQPRPSKLPLTEEFNVQLGVDVLECKDANGQSWSWLNILCQGTTFQICVLLTETSRNPTSEAVLEAFDLGWTSWASFPERGVFSDRAKPFLAQFSEALAAEGCYFEAAARASPWQLGQIERHGAIWKNMMKKVVWSEQVAGRESMLHATAAVNQAKNSLVRKSGFSPMQWVLGRNMRLPSDLTDDSEAIRLGALALSMTPGTRFYQKTKLRFAAREAFVQVSNSEALKRAELRKVKPSRGPFPVGTYVFYFDASVDQGQHPGPSCWRGVARVIGHEGSHTIWLSHRGLLLAVSPEHLAFAFDQEVQQWTTLGNEMELLDTQPAAGGTGFLDLRGQAKPPAEGFSEGEAEDGENDELPKLPHNDGRDPMLEPVPEELRESAQPLQEPPQPDLSSGSTSMERMELESERARKREVKSFDFFESKAKARREAKAERMSAAPAAASVPVPQMEFDPDLHDYHQHAPSQQLPSIAEDEITEAQERAAKRLRVGEEESRDAALFAYHVVENPKVLESTARASYFLHEEDYMSHGVTFDQFMFGVRRNDFTDKYLGMYEFAMGASVESTPLKKKGRKEIRLNDLEPQLRDEFLGQDGSDAKEWRAWQEKEAVDILSEAESRRIRENRPDLIIPTRWVRTNKNDGLINEPFKAKSRLVVQGFKDKSLGFYRRDAPTASALAESLCLAVTAYMSFTLICKDVKNAYFSGRSVERDIYLEQPKGGLGTLKAGQLLKARKAIYGFSEAARMFWLVLKGHLESDGWQESRLEPALFFLRIRNQLKGILVTHVDDVEGGIAPDCLEVAFKKSGRALEYATNHFKEFIFRGRELKQHDDGHIDVSMKNYAHCLRKIKISNTRKRQLESSLTAEELEEYQSGAGELGWITRQLRCDLAYENGVIQRSKSDACVGDLIRLKQYLGMARRCADFRMRFWSDVDLRSGVLVHLADSGHANGTPEKDDIARYRSVGGFFLMIANEEILEGKEARANILAFHSGMTKRVCRSTLAAKASHLAEAVEAGDWCIVLLEEALSGEVNLKDWPEVIQRRRRVYVTDARSVFDYLQKDATSTSTDKRMAIEGALLRETVRQRNAEVRWIDGMQNVANVLTKANADKEELREFLRSGKTSLVQSEHNRKVKEKKREERQRRAVKSNKAERKAVSNEKRRRELAEQIRAEGSDDSDDVESKEK